MNNSADAIFGLTTEKIEAGRKLFQAEATFLWEAKSLDNLQIGRAHV